MDIDTVESLHRSPPLPGHATAFPASTASPASPASPATCKVANRPLSELATLKAKLLRESAIRDTETKLADLAQKMKAGKLELKRLREGGRATQGNARPVPAAANLRAAIYDVSQRSCSPKWATSYQYLTT